MIKKYFLGLTMVWVFSSVALAEGNETKGGFSDIRQEKIELKSAP